MSIITRTSLQIRELHITSFPLFDLKSVKNLHGSLQQLFAWLKTKTQFRCETAFDFAECPTRPRSTWSWRFLASAANTSCRREFTWSSTNRVDPLAMPSSRWWHRNGRPGRHWTSPRAAATRNTWANGKSRLTITRCQTTYSMYTAYTTY